MGLSRAIIFPTQQRFHTGVLCPFDTNASVSRNTFILTVTLVFDYKGTVAGFLTTGN